MGRLQEGEGGRGKHLSLQVDLASSQDRTNYIKPLSVQACRCPRRRGSDILHFNWPVAGLNLLSSRGEKIDLFDHYAAKQEKPDPQKETCLTEVGTKQSNKRF